MRNVIERKEEYAELDEDCLDNLKDDSNWFSLKSDIENGI